MNRLIVKALGLLALTTATALASPSPVTTKFEVVFKGEAPVEVDVALSTASKKIVVENHGSALEMLALWRTDTGADFNQSDQGCRE